MTEDEKFIEEFDSVAVVHHVLTKLKFKGELSEKGAKQLADIELYIKENLDRYINLKADD